MRENNLPIDNKNDVTYLNLKNNLFPKLKKYADSYPENRRRRVNKVLFKNEYFQLIYSTKNNELSISSGGDLVYSAIPYDTARTYIQKAAVHYLRRPEEVHNYLRTHKENILTYIIKSVKMLTGEEIKRDSKEAITFYEEIFEYPLFEIQILGRMMQHDETGPLSANLPGKFLLSENIKTGIAGYVFEYLRFLNQTMNTLPIVTDGKRVDLLNEATDTLLVAQPYTEKLYAELLPTKLSEINEEKEAYANALKYPLLKSEFGKEIKRTRKQYVAHSVHPDELTAEFSNVLGKQNHHLVNVVSDIHALDGNLPLLTTHFNILAGDISDSHVIDQQIQGIYVLGNHELLDVLPPINIQSNSWEKWQQFKQEEWFKQLVKNPDESWYLLPTGEHPYYESVKATLEERFTQMHILNNESMYHDGVRYIGLTIPVALTARKEEQQSFIFVALSRLLEEDKEIPTVIVSHAPLFNELSLLSPKSNAYNPDYVCINPGIESLFSEYNIVGVIHGHHHLPASSGRFKKVHFANKDIYVICSIFSNINSGFDLTTLIHKSN